MNYIVLFLVPDDISREQFVATLRKHFESREFSEVASELRPKTVTDANQLPLWQWFISAK